MGELRDNLGRFNKGVHSNEPIEYKIKRMYSLEESWKKRPDYIADIKDIHPRIYNSWRGIRFTEKGKKIGNDPSWNSFRAFYNDVVSTYKKGLLFRRLDTTKEYSKANFIWVTQKEAILLKSNLVWIEYDGKNLTLKQWADELSVGFHGVKHRYYNREKRGYTIKEILYGRVINRFSKNAKDKSVVKSIRSKASKMISSYKSNDKRKGLEICDLSIDWMIENIINKECAYCGDVERVGCDRISNIKGHTKDNVVPCCYECNVARSNNFSVEEMMILGKTIKSIKDARNK